MFTSQLFKIFFVQMFFGWVVADLTKIKKCMKFNCVSAKIEFKDGAEIEFPDIGEMAYIKPPRCMNECAKRYVIAKNTTKVDVKGEENYFPYNIGKLKSEDAAKPPNADFSKRRRAPACGKHRNYDIRNGYPLNPAGATGVPGKGKLPFWGPNVISQLAFIRVVSGKYEFLGKGNESDIFFENFGSDAENGFRFGLLAEMEETARNATVADKVATSDIDPFSAMTEVNADIKKKSKILLSGSIPSPLNGDNGWLEIESRIILCKKKHSGFCSVGLDAVAKKYSLKWAPLHNSKVLNKMDKTKMMTYPNVTSKDIPLYSAFCTLQWSILQIPVVSFVRHSIGGMVGFNIVSRSIMAVAITLGLPTIALAISLGAIIALVSLLKSLIKRYRYEQVQ